MGYWPLVLSVLKNSDIVLIVADARMPEITRNSELLEKALTMKKRQIIIFNKIDLISKHEIEKLKKEYPDSFFISCEKRKGIEELKKFLENKADNWSRQSLRIGIVGYPNVGKSALVNLLAPKANAKVSKVSGTTKKTNWIRIGNLRIMDSPGVIPQADAKVKVGMVAAKDPHKMKNPEKIAIRIIEHLNEKDKKILEKFYKIKSENDEDTFIQIAKKKGFLIKGGEIDEHRTAIKILEDWQQGRIKLI